MKEEEILRKLFCNENITKDEYEKLLKDLEARNKKNEEDSFTTYIFKSINKDLSNVINYLSSKKIFDNKVEDTVTTIKEDIVKEIKVRKLKKISKNNKLKKSKAINVKEQKILHKIIESINTLNINIPIDYIEIIGSENRNLEIVANYFLENQNTNNILRLVQKGESVTLFLEDYIKNPNINITMKLPYNYLKNINIKCEDSNCHLKKLNLNNINIVGNQSSFNLKNNKVNNLNVELKKSKFKSSKLNCNNLSLNSNFSKIKIDFKYFFKLGLKLNNSYCDFRGDMRNNCIRIKEENKFSKILYDKKFENIQKVENITYLNYNDKLIENSKKIDCKLIRSNLKIS